MESDANVLDEQVSYYRARAGEYDEWWDRRGRYDRGPAATQAWYAERAQVMRALDHLKLRGDILEFASGTGIWTVRLARTARSVTAIDSSPEMHALNRARLGRDSSRVTFLVTDIFAWRPERLYDSVVFCFWLSHVPKDRLDEFLSSVASALRRDGRLFFVDSKRETTSTAANHALPDEEAQVMIRRLNSGAEYRVVKNFWTADELEERCAAARLAVKVEETQLYFLYGTGSKT